jgi:hypothetical protein
MTDYININVNLKYKNALNGLKKIEREQKKINRASKNTGGGGMFSAFSKKASGAVTSLKGLTNAVKTGGGGMKNLSGMMGMLGGATGGVITAVVGATAAFAGFLTVVFKLNQSLAVTNRVFEATFSENLGIAEATVNSLSSSLSISGLETKKYLGDISDQFAGLGFTSMQSLKMAEGALDSAAKIARFRGLSMQESLEAVSKGMMGGTESLRRFGVVIKQNDKDFIKLKNSIMETTGATEKQATAQAVLQEIARQSPNAFKSFDKVDMFTKFQGMWSNFKESLTNLSQIFMPFVDVFVRFFEKINKQIKQYSKKTSVVGNWFKVIVQVLAQILDAAMALYSVFSDIVYYIDVIWSGANDAVLEQNKMLTKQIAEQRQLYLAIKEVKDKMSVEDERHTKAMKAASDKYKEKGLKDTGNSQYLKDAEELKRIDAELKKVWRRADRLPLLTKQAALQKRINKYTEKEKVAEVELAELQRKKAFDALQLADKVHIERQKLDKITKAMSKAKDNQEKLELQKKYDAELKLFDKFNKEYQKKLKKQKDAEAKAREEARKKQQEAIKKQQDAINELKKLRDEDRFNGLNDVEKQKELQEKILKLQEKIKTAKKGEEELSIYKELKNLKNKLKPVQDRLKEKVRIEKEAGDEIKRIREQDRFDALSDFKKRAELQEKLIALNKKIAQSSTNVEKLKYIKE